MNCTVREGRRVVRHRHLDECPGEGCTGCLPCTQPHCRTCRHTHADTTCAACLAMARSNLADLAAMHHRLGEEATEGRTALHNHNGVPGGEALVLLAPGTYRPRGHRLPEERPNDANPPREVLAHWAGYWQAHTGQQVDAHSVNDLHSYLDGQLHRMAQAPTFPMLFRDLAQAVHHLEDVLHDGHRPETSRVPCWECGTRLEKRYGDTAAADHWVCPRCKERYDRGRYDRAKHDHLASEGAERYVLLADAVAAIGRSMKTVRTWMDRGLVTARRDPKTGRVFVWWPDVRSRHLEAATRNSRRKP